MPTLDPEDPTVQIAALGHNVQEFLQSDVGDYLLKRAAGEEANATDAILRLVLSGKSVPAEIITALSNARSFQLWLGEAVEHGLQAITLLKEESHD